MRKTGLVLFLVTAVVSAAVCVALLLLAGPTALPALVVGAFFPLAMTWVSRDVAMLEDRFEVLDGRGAPGPRTYEEEETERERRAWRLRPRHP